MMATAFLGKLLAQNGDMLLHLNPIDTISCCSAAPLIYSERLQAFLSKHTAIKPILSWESLHLPNIKDSVYPALKRVAGIYLIVNLVTGESYVGSAVLGRMHIRFHKHLFGGTGNKPLWNGVQKYGLDNFAFLVIDEIPGFTPADNQQLLNLETTYITAYGDYNIAPEAGNTLGVTHTEAQRALMRANYSQERRDMIGALNRGKNLSPDTVELIRAAALSRPPMTDETRAKVSANSAKAMLFELSMLDGSTLPGGTSSIVLRTIPTVAQYCSCDEKTVRRAIKGKGTIKGKWLIKSLGLATSIKS
jgi:group I intron endonuclease